MHISSIMTISSSRTHPSATLVQCPWLVNLHMRRAVGSTQAVQTPSVQEKIKPALTHSKFWMYSTSTRVLAASASRMASMCGGRTSEDTYCFRRRTRPSAWNSREFARISSHSRATCLFYTAHSVSATGQLIKQQWGHCSGQALSCSLQSICTSPVQGLWDREHLLSSTWVHSEVARKGALPVEGRHRARA